MGQAHDDTRAVLHVLLEGLVWESTKRGKSGMSNLLGNFMRNSCPDSLRKYMFFVINSK